jgi:hypothetical protein
MRRKITLLCAVSILLTNYTFGQSTEKDSNYKRYYIGSTFMMLGNLSTTNKPNFVQLNFGYRITPKDVVSIETKTWKYAWPLGIPYGKHFEAPDEKFPGYIREYGIGFTYQRFLWKRAYVSVDAMNALQKFVDNDDNKIKNGYQLFMTYRLGYHIPLFKNRFFIEPSIAITHRPIHTSMPESFAQLDDKWAKFFIGEPGLHFGINF